MSEAPASPAEDLGIPGVENAVQVGSGGFATVYRARQPSFGRDVAVKVIDRRLDEIAITRFRRECLAIGQLGGHPAIVTVFEAGQTSKGRPYLLMPFHEAGSLQDRLDHGATLSWEEACAVGIRMASALSEAHEAGVLHRDMKPANILVSRYGEAVLTDFGIARVADGPETTSGTVTASLAHAAPEVLNGARPTAAADVYSLGSTLYALIAGRAAFHSDTDESVLPHMHRILTTDPPDLGPSVPDGVRQAIRQAMAKNPADRPPSASAFARQLQEAQAAAGVAPTSLVGLSEPPPIPSTVVEGPDGRGGGAPAVDGPGRGGAGAAGAGVTDSGPLDTVAVPWFTAPAGPSPSAQPRGGPLAGGPLSGGPPSGGPPHGGPPPGHPPAAGGFLPLTGAPALAAPPGRRRAPLLVGLAGLLAVVVVAGVLLMRPDGDPAVPGGVDVASFQDGVLPEGIDIDPAVRPLVAGQPVEAELAEGQALAFRFAAPEAGWLSLLVRGTGDGFDPVLQLFDGDGGLLDEDDDSAGGVEGHDPFLFTMVDPAGGPYTAVVRGFSAEDRGAFQLGLEAADVRDLPETTDTGSFDGEPDHVPAVVYTFDGEAGDAASIAMRSDTIDSYLQLYRADGSVVIEDDDSGGGTNGTDAALQVEIDTTGPYALVALQFDWANRGDWTLEVDY